jgi:hypothetical protein
MKKLINTLENNKDLQKAIAKTGNEYYKTEDFLQDAKSYIKAIQERRMLCTIESVSASGMSRVLKFNSCEKNTNTKSFYYRSYGLLFKTLGFTEVKNSYAFRVNGCGMDMVFHTNYTIIRKFLNLGIINKEQAQKLEQMTPTKL